MGFPKERPAAPETGAAQFEARLRPGRAGGQAEAFAPYAIPASTGPVRRVVRRGHGGYVSIFHSTKSAVPVECEGMNEYRFMQRVEAEHRVTKVAHQPFHLTWNDDGRKRDHVPDFDLVFAGHRCIVEVKEDSKVDGEILKRTRWFQRHLIKEGVHYRLVRKSQIIREPAYAIATIVSAGSGCAPSMAQAEAIVRELATQASGMTIEALLDRLGAGDSVANEILALIIAGRIAPVPPATLPIRSVMDLVVRCAGSRIFT